MKLSTFTFALAVLLAFVIGNTLAVSDEGDDKPKMPDMAQFKALTEPGPQHKAMDYLIGDWDVAIKLVMPGAGDAPASKGSATFGWAIDGRWVTQRLEGSVMGTPYEGYGIHGYDNHTKNYVTCWVSSMDTQMITMRGPSVDPTNKVTAEYGRLNEWMDNTFNKAIKGVTTRVDENTFTFVLWDLQIGPDGAPVFEYTYTRKQ